MTLELHTYSRELLRGFIAFCDLRADLRTGRTDYAPCALRVDQCARNESPIAVLSQAAIPKLGEFEHVLDDPEGVLERSADTQPVAVALLLSRCQLLAAVRASAVLSFALGNAIKRRSIPCAPTSETIMC